MYIRITLSGVCLSDCLSGSQTFLLVTHSYVSKETHAFLGMLPLLFVLFVCFCSIERSSFYIAIFFLNVTQHYVKQASQNIHVQHLRENSKSASTKRGNIIWKRRKKSLTLQFVIITQFVIYYKLR